MFPCQVEKNCTELYSRAELIFRKLITTVLHIYLFICFWCKNIFSHLVIESENFKCAFSIPKSFINSLLICLLFKSLKTVLWYVITFKRAVAASLSWLFLSSIICEYYCLSIIVNIKLFSDLSISLNTTLKYYDSQGLNKKLKLMGGAMKFFSIKGYEIFNSKVPLATKYFLKNL